MAQAAPVKRSELQLVVAVVACVMLALTGLKFWGPSPRINEQMIWQR